MGGWTIFLPPFPLPFFCSRKKGNNPDFSKTTKKRREAGEEKNKRTLCCPFPPTPFELVLALNLERLCCVHVNDAVFIRAPHRQRQSGPKRPWICSTGLAFPPATTILCGLGWLW